MNFPTSPSACLGLILSTSTVVTIHAAVAVSYNDIHVDYNFIHVPHPLVAN